MLLDTSPVQDAALAWWEHCYATVIEGISRLDLASTTLNAKTHQKLVQKLLTSIKICQKKVHHVSRSSCASTKACDN
jgi:hypothetical protein